MTFLSPERLWLIAGVVALGTVYVVLQARRPRYTMKFTNLALLASVAPSRPGWRRHVPATLFLVAMVILVLGFARPARQERVPKERATIIMAIDTSLSMMATDVAPSRIDAAKAAAKSFADILPPQLNVGLVAFNGRATLKVPPTTDRERLKKGIDSLELGERTAIGEGIFTSLDAIEAAPADGEGRPPAHIVLMSDGETTDGRPNGLAAQAAKEAGVPVSTIAFGTDEGTIRLPGEPMAQRVAVNRPALEAIADQTGGKFYSAVTEGQLREVYENIGTQIGYTTEEREIAATFTGAGLAVLALAAALSLLWFSRLP
ncbi:MAG: VWA domain-containing protein [Acidimicrobiales bacterium]|nr:VWA domain-containing protein [Acidimicrobiales bacterium]